MDAASPDIAIAVAGSAFGRADTRTALDIDTCVVAGTPATQSRGRVKHRLPPVPPPTPQARTVSSFVSAKAACDNLCEPATLFSEETRLVTVRGSIWRVGLDPKDCDIHVEMSEPGASSDDERMILEVPNDAPYMATRHRLDDAVRRLTRTGLTKGKPRNLTNPISATFTGYPFWDGHHFCASSERAECPGVLSAGCSHGTPNVCTLWEVHPAVGVQLE